jgi:hypothetical protein
VANSPINTGAKSFLSGSLAWSPNRTVKDPNFGVPTLLVDDTILQGSISNLTPGALSLKGAQSALKRTGLPTTNTSYSVMGWAKYDSRTNDDSFIFVDDAAGTGLALEFKGGVLKLVDTFGFINRATVGSTLVDQKWYFVGLRVNGTAATIFLGDETTACISSSGTIVAQGGSPTAWFSYSSDNLSLQGGLAFWKLYDAQLTDLEFEKERLRPTPARTTNLSGFWKFESEATKLVDSAGSNTLTANNSAGPWANIAGPSIRNTAQLQVGVLMASSVVSQAALTADLLTDGSLEFNSQNDRLTRTTNLPARNNITFAAFLRLTAAQTGGDGAIFAIDDAAQYQVLEVPNGTTNLHLFHNPGVFNELTILDGLTLNAWYFVAYTSDGTNLRGYIRQVTTGAAFTKSTLLAGGNPTADTMYFGTDGFAEPITGIDIRAPRIWEAVLTEDELYKEALSFVPVRTANINSAFAFRYPSDKLTDISGNARDLTAPSTGPWAQGPVVPLQPVLIATISNAAALTADLTTGASTGMAANVVAGAALTAALSTNITAAASIVDAAVLTAALTTNIRAAAAITDAAVLTAALTTDIKMAAAVADAAVVTAALTTDIRMAANITAGATVTANLLVPKPLAASITDAAALTASLSTNITAAASITDAAVVTAALSTNITAAASIVDAAVVTAALSTNIRMAASVVDAAVVTGALSTDIRLAASVADLAVVTAALSTDIRLAGAITDAAVLTANLSTAIRLAASITDAAALTAALNTDIRFAATISDAAVVTAALTTDIKLAANISSQAVLTADLSAPSAGASFAANIVDAAVLTASLSTNIRVAASITDAAVLTANLNTSIRAAASITDAAVLSAALSTDIRLAAVITDAAVLTADLSITPAPLMAAIVSQAQITAALSTDIKLMAAIVAQGQLTAALTAAGGFVATEVPRPAPAPAATPVVTAIPKTFLIVPTVIVPVALPSAPTLFSGRSASPQVEAVNLPSVPALAKNLKLKPS